ncbi:2-amino-4-hydroxy-6-hydroxymethyldihydropteridine diphosphokinase [Croceicoccus marinus]|uniref:2-amino-4-hydroxy-6-hydroxymethyldihydropteridine pyrophosphokinase n=1 Tax=Croceicoccus marinus TaxID=450378 RepID=A0A1Z1F814_9SPHN|nr:2-amino-4-hydroxy-6-hydroxymethyldihydropteridine diphosphokinase [Croceicoccus marinus]ARU14938.1 2-amino-4-hydroxy-6-hydroxymethyldihydropteridine diphosphokinase [Croceicoccus marinus]
MHAGDRQHYLIGLGSNMRHVRHGSPAQVVRKAIERLHAASGCTVEAMSDIVRSAPVGPSAREYANAACVVGCDMSPKAMLAHVNAIEHAFGRRRSGQRWRQRTLDLDILLWSGGSHAASDLLIPHPQLPHRAFVLGPAVQIAGEWRDPLSGLSLRHLHARLTRPRPLPR